MSRQGASLPTTHRDLGSYSRKWPYFGADGELQGYVARFDLAGGGKEIRPLRYGKRKGRIGWHWHGWHGSARPLYNLPCLAARPDAEVLVTEGEKSADAAAALLPQIVVVAAMNGAKAPQKTDWSPLSGRAVTIWPDADKPGREFAEVVGRLAKSADASLVKIVTVPDGAPEGWDLADDLPSEWTGATVMKALAEAAVFDPDGEVQGGFRVLYRRRGDHAAGVYAEVERKDPETGEKRAEWIWFCSRLDVLADTRDLNNEEWGRLLAIHTRDGVEHRWSMPMSMMAGSGKSYRAKLLSLGMVLSSNRAAWRWLADYLSQWNPRRRARCTDRIGWHSKAFVLPNLSYGGDTGEQLLLQTAGVAPQFGTAGTLDGWKTEVAALAVGNSRLLLAISTAFAGPLIHLVGEESGGFHLHGPSSIGKTADLHAARSVWGTPLGTWRTTDNAAEAIARGASDTLLTLDEIGQAPAGVVEALAYLLGNQRGKSRMRRDATARASLTWRILFLSTGELGLAARLAEGGRRVLAGQHVRVVEIPADAGAGLGIYENLHGFVDGAAFAEHLRDVADRQCGHAGRRFVELLTGRHGDCAAFVREARTMFVDEQCPTGADGQVRRVAGRFGLVAAAGELASQLGITPWGRGEAEKAAIRCFADWLEHRGGTVAAEITIGIKQVRLFLELHGSSRFEPAWALAAQDSDTTKTHHHQSDHQPRRIPQSVT